MYSYGPPHMAEQKQDNMLEHTYSSYVRIQDVALKTSQRRWMIGRSGERGSGISMLAARHDVDDDDDERFYEIVAINLPFNRRIGLVDRVFANGPGDPCSIPGRVIPKTLRMILDTSLLITQHYKVRIKGKVEQSKERSSALSFNSV